LASQPESPVRNIASVPRTKLIATIGPACRDPAMLRQLIARGVDVFRLNMAHGKADVHDATVRDIRAASAAEDRPVGILVDLAGPKIRLGQLVEDPLTLEPGETVAFVRGTQPGGPRELTCTYAPMVDEVAVGNSIVLADGIARLEVIARSADRLECRVVDGGTIRSRQGVNMPATRLSVAALSDLDRSNAVWAAKAGVEFISLSFVRCAAEMNELCQLVRGAGGTALLVAKIEKREALEHLDEIVAAADCVMVARGDLGVEIDIEKTPLAQKRIIRLCSQLGRPVIVATQMLESMHHSRQPTRAEVSDVANAILDGADACMLSGETAIGDYPVDAVRMMKRIMFETEQNLRHRSSRMQSRESDSGWGLADSVMLGVAQIARRLDARLVVILSSDPRAALIKSKQRDFVPTAFLSDSAAAVRQMCLYWGIVPVESALPRNIEQLSTMALDWASSKAGLGRGDRVVMVLDNEFLPGVHDTVMVGEVQ
jgi:pyruvate kinase